MHIGTSSFKKNNDKKHCLPFLTRRSCICEPSHISVLTKLCPGLRISPLRIRVNSLFGMPVCFSTFRDRDSTLSVLLTFSIICCVPSSSSTNTVIYIKENYQQENFEHSRVYMLSTFRNTTLMRCYHHDNRYLLFTTKYIIHINHYFFLSSDQFIYHEKLLHKDSERSH